MQKKRTGSLYELQNGYTPVPANDTLSIITSPATGEGNAAAGYQYMIGGNAFNSGIPAGLYKFFNRIKDSKLGQLSGYGKFAINDFTVFKNEYGKLTATPGCLHCHAQQFNGQLIIGLGNSYNNFQATTTLYLRLLEKAIRTWYGKNSAEWKKAEMGFAAARVLAGTVQLQMQGPTPAQKIAEVMASHRDPVTLLFRTDTSYFFVPPIVIPEDPPALWISKKRKALTVNAMRQGDFVKHITSTSLLTMKDTAEAREINNHSKDLWAYLQQLEVPKYPYPINQQVAEKGKQLFLQTCSRCHGTYEGKGYYPNELVPAKVIGTDSLQWKYFLKYPGYTDWFNKSWFARSGSTAFTKPQTGYVPPPLDGIWITAPYLHNGSVPTLESLLNSKIRPVYWERNFNKEEYDYEKLGWRYKRLAKPGGKKTYNTRIPGYGNYGHTFGDHLSGEERKAVIEYLKTL